MLYVHIHVLLIYAEKLRVKQNKNSSFQSHTASKSRSQESNPYFLIADLLLMLKESVVLTPSQGMANGRIKGLLETWALQTGEDGE